MQSNLQSTSIFSIIAVFFTAIMLLSYTSCSLNEKHLINAINEQDSLPTLSSTGISTLISDSGVIRYKLVTEKWDIYTKTDPTKWEFIKGLYIEQFDEDMHVSATIQADTAYFFDMIKLWELRGRVFVRNREGTIFRTKVLFWDQKKREFYSHENMLVITPDRELRGTEFRSNEDMTNYIVSNPKGYFPMSDTEQNEEGI
ncbi:MAG: LPS export ABC transporter periplasmic protein LptC [Bacteroidaceae bacterium]|nr:LPS export ABC transporter periplasmic protein LptC [Bacteroidaceae bacterium]